MKMNLNEAMEFLQRDLAGTALTETNAESIITENRLDCEIKTMEKALKIVCDEDARLGTRHKITVDFCGGSFEFSTAEIDYQAILKQVILEAYERGIDAEDVLQPAFDAAWME